jgi:hypothetical protein
MNAATEAGARIMVADFLPQAESALEWAFRLGHAFGAKLVLP